MKTSKIFLFVAITFATLSTASIVKAQTTPAPFGEVSFIKVKPGMTESYLIDMKTSKKLNNSLKANKNILSWQLYRRVYPRGSEMAFDYASMTVFPSAKEMEARKDWVAYNAPLKELSAKESIDYISSLGNVRNTVQTELYDYKMGVGAAIKPGEFVQLNMVNVNIGSSGEVEKMWESLKPVIEMCIKAGELKGFNIWKRTYVTNQGTTNDYTATFSFSSLDQALSWASGKTGMADEYKKIYPNSDLDAYTKKLNSLRVVVAQELWELVEITD